jgi:acyl dehydratase
VRVPRDVVKGYTVVYRYGGREITTTLPYDPGPTVRVGVSVVDAPSRPASPTAGMLGTNVREVTRPAPPPASAPASVPSGNPGGYPYRY